tara:strand:- start:837 stop:1097 length:261 start_codon:yes stop_codon:yes gene_type:complete
MSKQKKESVKNCIVRNTENLEVFKPLPMACVKGEPIGDIYPDKDEKEMLVQHLISEYKEAARWRKEIAKNYISAEQFLTRKHNKDV